MQEQSYLSESRIATREIRAKYGHYKKKAIWGLTYSTICSGTVFSIPCRVFSASGDVFLYRIDAISVTAACRRCFSSGVMNFAQVSAAYSSYYLSSVFLQKWDAPNRVSVFENTKHKRLFCQKVIKAIENGCEKITDGYTAF